MLFFASTLVLVPACAAPPRTQKAISAATQQASATTAAAPAQAVSEVGDIRVTAITHASFQLEHGGKVIHVDPTAAAKVRKAGAPVVAPAAAAEKLESPTVIANGETKTVAGISIEAVPMYNLRRGPSPGQLFHPKGRGNGYILTLGSRRVYVAGDTECTDEMRALKNIDIAFIPTNLPYTMPPAEAAECAKAFKPKVVFPYHYRGQNPEEFKTALKDERVEVRLLEWYPARPATGAAQ